MKFALAIAACAGLIVAQSKLTPLDQSAYAKMIATHKGKIVLVDFWATWCVPCRAEMPQLVKLSQKLGQRGVEFVTVSSDEPGKIPDAFKVLMQNAVAPPFYVKQTKDDDKFYNSVDPKWSGEIPAMFIYDRSGRRVRSFLGETPVATVEAAIQKYIQ